MSELKISQLEDRVDDIVEAYARLRKEKLKIEAERNELRSKNRDLRKRIEVILERIRSLELEHEA